MKIYPPPYSPFDFPAGSRILDVGCGKGEELLELRARGFDAVGVDPNEDFVRSTRSLGLETLKSSAEKLPFPDASFDGVLCIAVFPYTDLPESLAEISRVLKPGGIGRFVFHGIGYCLRQIVGGPGVIYRIYGARSLFSGALFQIASLKFGDTLYHSRAQLKRAYRRNDLEMIQDLVEPKFIGLPVFLFHAVRKHIDLASARRT